MAFLQFIDNNLFYKLNVLSSRADEIFSGQTRGSAPTQFTPPVVTRVFQPLLERGSAFQPDTKSLFMPRVLFAAIRVVRFN